MDTAELIFEQFGLKMTASRLEVAGVLIASSFPLTHQEILKRLPSEFDRVTLYRVLDWLLKKNVIHRIAGEDRTWRFQMNHHDKKSYQLTEKNARSRLKIIQSHSHAHFKCSLCGKVFCLNDVFPQLSSNVPSDFAVESIELNIIGQCAVCRPPSSSHQ